MIARSAWLRPPVVHGGAATRDRFRLFRFRRGPSCRILFGGGPRLLPCVIVVGGGSPMSAHLVRAFLVLIALLSESLPAQAQGKKYALVVGVSEYDSSTFVNLKYTENDAEQLAAVLKKAGYDEVVVLTTARGKKDDKLEIGRAHV